MSPKCKNKKDVKIEKVIDFGKQLFATVLRSRKGALTELSRLLRFQKGTKGFHREYERLLPLIGQLQEAYKQCVLAAFQNKGLRLGIIDDTNIKKTGQYFPHEKVQHDHATNYFFSGMKVISSAVYQYGKVATIKVATISSRIVKEDDNKLLLARDDNKLLLARDDNKLLLARDDVNLLIDDYFVDLFLFDSWYCKSPLLEKIRWGEKIFISRLRTDSSVKQEGKRCVPLNALLQKIPHKDYTLIKIKGKSYWIYEATLNFKTYGSLRVIASKEGAHKNPVFFTNGSLRVIASKEGAHKNPVFFTTNTDKFIPKFIVKLYLKRFSIEVFFKDAKQFLNFETFLCRNAQKWDAHLLLTNVVHWAIQKKNSISKTVRKIQENISECLFFINENLSIKKFFDELRKKCQT